MTRILVYQSNGVQGRAVLEHSKRAGYTTRALIRDQSKAALLRENDFEVAVADFTDYESLMAAHNCVDYVIAQIPAYSDAFAELAAKNAVAAMKQQGVRGAILKMASVSPRMATANTGFSTNTIVISALAASSIPYSVVEPTMYLDTLLKPNICAEISSLYLIDLPIANSLNIAWTCVDDAARLSIDLLRNNIFGMTVRCAGEKEYSGTELAELFSSVLGRVIKFESTNIDRFQGEIEGAIGIENAKPIISKFRFLKQHRQEAQYMLGATDLTQAIRAFKPTAVRDWIELNKLAFK